MKAIRVEMVEFKPMTAEEAEIKGYKTNCLNKSTEGYEVTYPDGYKSWSPKDVFDAAYFKLADETGTKILQDDVWNFLVKGEATKLGAKTTVVMDSTITGFDMIGTAACVDPKTYDMSIGQEIARRDILDTLWGHMGFVLQWAKFGLVGNNEKEVSNVPPNVACVIEEYKQLYDRTQKLGTLINDNPLFKTLSEDEQDDMKDQLMSMQKYSNMLARRLDRVDVDCTKV